MKNTDKLYGLAEDQYGYFTAVQAIKGGVKRPSLTKLARTRQIERVAWGVYRLSNFPRSPLDQYMEATLWPREVQGIISHDTALQLHGVSDVNPDRIHFTVPAHYRIRRAVPRLYSISRANLPKEHVTSHEGIPITTLPRTIRDCSAAHLGPALIHQAITQGLATGLLDNADAAALEQQFAPIGHG